MEQHPNSDEAAPKKVFKDAVHSTLNVEMKTTFPIKPAASCSLSHPFLLCSISFKEPVNTNSRSASWSANVKEALKKYWTRFKHGSFFVPRVIKLTDVPVPYFTYQYQNSAYRKIPVHKNQCICKICILSPCTDADSLRLDFVNTNRELMWVTF